MLDADRLRTQLMAALLLTCGACDGDAKSKPETKLAESESKSESKSEAEPEADPEPEPETKLDLDPEPEPETKLDPEPDPKPETIVGSEEGTAAKPGPRGSCPNGDWCGTKETAKPLAVEGTKMQLGCPVELGNTSGGIDPRAPEYRDLHWSSRSHASLLPDLTKETRKKGEANACCYHWVQRCPGGRPLLDDQGRMVRPAVRGTAANAPTDARGRAAMAWVEDARTEFASVASFLRVVRELRRVGAPGELVAAAEDAADDELEHTRLCLEVAARLGVPDVELDPVPQLEPRSATLSQLVCDTFAEGAVGETVAALAAMRAAEHCDDPKTRVALERIAEDEARHAELAWRTIRWAVARGGPEVRRALLREIDRARSALEATQPENAHRSDSEWLALGRLDTRSLARVRQDAWAVVIDPLLALV